jgi:hypothetical protein
VGVTSFFCYTLFQQRGEADDNMMSYIAIGFAFVTGTLSVIVPQIMVSSQIEQIANGTFSLGNKSVEMPDTDEVKLAAVYQTTTIVACALLEAAGFFNTHVYLEDGQIAIAILVVLGVLLHFPTVNRVKDWIDRKKYDLEMQRKSMPLEK